MNIYKQDGTVRQEIKPDEGSQLSRKVMGEDVATLSFSLPFIVPFTIGDYADIFGDRYTVNKLPEVSKISTRQYDYTLTLEAAFYDLAKVQFLFPDSQNNYNQTDFSITGNIGTMLTHILANISRIYPGWQLGNIPNTTTKTVSFSGENCLSVLAKLADEFEQEYYFEGQTIHFGLPDETIPVTFQYGKGKGLYKITRTNTDSTNIITRLYLYGGEKNIPADYRGYQTRLRPNGEGYIDSANISKYRIIEAHKTFDDIFPKRVGVVSAVADPFTFTDDQINFDVNSQLIPGVTAKLTFNTGQLAGYQFEIAKFQGKEFTIIKNQNEKALDLPSDLFSPAVGDEYVLTDIIMPQSYINDAEGDLISAGQDYLAANDEPRVTYSVDCDPLFFRDQDVVIGLGKKVGIVDAEFGLNKAIRVTGYRRSITSGWKYDLDLAESVAPQAIVRIISAQKEVNRVIIQNRLTDIARAKRAWRTSDEIYNSVFDQTGNFRDDKISAKTVETIALLVGDKSQQYIIQSARFEGNVNGDPNTFRSTAGQLVSQYVNPDTTTTWNFPGSNFTGLDPTKLYYIYLRASKSGNDAIIALTPEQIKFDSQPGFYYFQIGELNSVFEGYRGLSMNEGQVLIYGGTVRAGRIQSNTGGTYFDLDAGGGVGEIGGVIRIVAGSSGYSNFVDAPDLNPLYAQSAEALQEAQDAQASINYLTGEIDQLRAQADGAIQNHTGDYEPTLTNFPASTWTDDATRDSHVLDTFTRTGTGEGAGNSWRFLKSGSTYIWQPITSTNEAALLARISQAEDLADRKRTTFVIQPYPPYEIGDLWVQGPSGELMRCVSARASGSFSASDWQVATKYTDDTRVINLQASLRGMAYQQKVEVASLGESLFIGGYLRNEFLDTQAIVVRGGGATVSQAQQIAINAVSGVKIGGRNYYRKGAAITTLVGTPDIIKRFDINGFQLIGKQNQLGSVRLNDVIDSAGSWVVSFMAKANAASGVKIDIADQSQTDVIIGVDWKKYELTVSITGENRFLDIENIPWIDFLFRDFKVEKGTKASDWTAAPEDVSEDASNKADAALAAAKVYADEAAQSKANVAQTQAIQAASTDAQNKADAARNQANALSAQLIASVKIGGKNYYKQSTPIYRLNEDADIVKRPDVNGFRIFGKQNKLCSVRIDPVTDGTPGPWVISGYATANAPASVRFDLADQGQTVVNIGTSPTRFEVPFNVTGTNSFIDIEQIPWIDFLFRDFKVEKGTKATDWSPAPEDVQSAIDYANQTAAAAAQAYSNLTASLKSLAYQDLKDVAINGVTLINGGYIRSVFIDVDAIRANVVTAEYMKTLEFEAKNITIGVGAKIASWTVGSQSISSILNLSDPGIEPGQERMFATTVYNANGQENSSRIGSNTISASSGGGRCTAYFDCSLPSSLDNTAVYARARNAGPGKRSYAIQAFGDVFVRTGGLFVEGTALNLTDGAIIIANGKQTFTGNIVIPSSPPVTIKVQNGLIYQ